MTEIQWTDQAVDAALDQWLPGQHADHQVPALRGAMIAALDTGAAEYALDAWDAARDEHARLDDGRPDILDQAPYFAAEPRRKAVDRRAVMRAAIDAAHNTQAKTA